MTQSKRFVIGQRIFAEVAGVAAQLDADALLNPRLPIEARGRRSKLLFVLDRGDRLLEQPGQREKRSSRIVLGALALSRSSEADADALHFAARMALKQQALRSDLAALGAPLVREVEVEAEVKDTVSEGALLLSAFEIEYLETYLAA